MKPTVPLFLSNRSNNFISFALTGVDWIFEQTQAEAEYRRMETHRVNTFVFIERLIGQLCALLIGLSGIVGGVYTAVQGQPEAGGAIAGLAITGLAAVFLTGRVKKPANDSK